MVEVLNFIQDTYLILVAVIGVVGYVIKRSEAIADKYIPIILLFLGAVLGSIMGLESDLSMIDSIMQGILCAGLAIGVNQVPKQLAKEE